MGQMKQTGSAGGLSLEGLAILREIRDRHQDAMTTPTPNLPWQCVELAEVIEHGPRFSALRWFGCAHGSAVARRYRRALAKLVADELVTSSRADDAKFANVRLTAAGELLFETS